MQKTTTSLNKTDFNFEEKTVKNYSQLQPRPSTLKNIMQFAAAYRVEKTGKDQYVELFLN